MLRYLHFILVIALSLIIFPKSVDAECNGITPTDGENWNVDELTHCWDQEIDVHDIDVSDGGLRLENVTLTVHGKITISHPSIWEASTITHNTSNNEDTIILESQLTVKGTNLTINAPEGVYAGSDIEGIRLDLGSKLIITDIDDNPLTKYDASTISSMNWNISDPFNGGLEIFSYGQDNGIILKNSVFHHIIQFKNHGNDVIITNNSFYNCSKLQQAWGDNLIFENNKIYNVTTDVGLRFWGNNASIKNNYFEDFNSTGSSGAIHVIGDNAEVANNTFVSMSQANTIIGVYGDASNVTISKNTINGSGYYAIALFGNGRNNTINYNNLTNVPHGVWARGENTTISNNYINECGWNDNPGYAGGCIVIALGGTETRLDNVTIENNTILNARQVGFMTGTAEREWGNITFNNNTINNATYSVFFTNSGGTYRPNNITIFNNNFSDSTIGISSYASYENRQGNNILIRDNILWNTTRGFDIDGTSLLHNNFNVLNNVVYSNETAMRFNELYGLNVSENKIFSESSAILLIDSVDAYLSKNTLEVTRNGFVSYDSNGNFTDNNITGKCLGQDCKTVYFSEVSYSGIKLTDGSEFTIYQNSIFSFEVSINISNSKAISTYNELEFSNTGIFIQDSESSLLLNNVILNSITPIEIKDSNGITANYNNISHFLIGVKILNSTANLENNIFMNGELCLEFIDSDYSLPNYDNFDCSDAYVYVRYNVNIHILTDDEIPSNNHQFYYYNEFDDDKKYSQTNLDGLSDYMLLTTLKVDNSGLNINFNNYYFGYYHNEILQEIELELNKNSTVMAYLDTSAPTTTLTTSASLINTEDITLHFNRTSDKNDLLDYDLFVLKNDGINFAQWEFVGTYNESSINYEGEDNTKYRFRVISKDIYGNVEIKNGYDCEVEVDSQTPESFFKNINEDYYFTGNNKILLDWYSTDGDISNYEIEIYYNSDTTPYTDEGSNDWVLENNLYYYEKDNLVYNLGNIGHYGFKLTAQDYAGNKETKSSFDFIVNYDSTSDRLTFAGIPDRWGEETLEISIDSFNSYLDFTLFIAMESVDYSTNKMTWYEHSEQNGGDTLTLEGLLDRTKYYLYAKSVDLAGNVEDPLNSTEVFVSDGTYDQKYIINYIPLAHGNYEFLVSVDNDFDGTYETILVRGYDQDDLNSNEYFLDTTNKSIIFGGLTNGGFIPNEDLNKIGNIKVEYSGVHAIIEVYTGNPLPAQGININPTNTTHITFEYNVPADSERCKVQLTTNISKGWFNEEIIEPCYKGKYIFTLLNPQLDKEYFFRVMIENEFGQTSYSESQSINMDDVVKLYTTTKESDEGLLGMDSIIPITALIGIIMLSFGGVLLYRSKDENQFDISSNILESKPVAKYKVEELYLIYKDGRLIKNISAVEVKTDSDIMSGMLTAINDFVQDSFNTEGDLGSIDYGNNKIILQRENHSYLAAVIYGEVDNYFKGKMINAVRKIEEDNAAIENWNGDSSSIINVQKNLEPIIAETESATREMVDNYFTEKEIAITTTCEKDNDNTTIKINLSNYSSTNITDCKIIPEYNDSLLGLSGIVPTVPYYFDRNTFEIGDIKSYNEVQFTLKMKNKSNDLTTIELKLEYNHKGRTSSTKSNVEIK